MDSRTERLSVILLLIQITWSATQAGKCGHSPLDVIFVLDESGSIWGPDFKKQLQFVQDLVDQFDIRPDGTRVGVETFGTTVRTIIELGEVMDAAQLKRHIDGIRQRRGGTATHLALKQLREMFSKSNIRPGASRVAIVITDGESENPQLTAFEASEVHNDGIEVFAIGVGRTVKRSELEGIASQDGFVFTVDDYNDLNSLLSILAIKACPTEETTPQAARAATTFTPVEKTTKKSWPEPAPATRTEEWEKVTPPTAKPTPKLFSLRPAQPKSMEGCDSSSVFNLYFGLPDQLGVLDSYLSLQFLREVTTLLNQSPSFIRPHLCPRTCPSTQPIPSVESTDPSNSIEFLAGLDSRQTESLTRNDLQLQYIQKQEEDYQRRHRADYDDFRSAVAILVIDNRLANMARLMKEIENSRRMGIQVVAIGVGDYVDPDEMIKIGSSARDLLYSRSYNYLPTIRDALLQRVCLRGLVHSAQNSLRRDFD